MPPSTTQIEQLSAQLERRYFPHLPTLTHPGRSPEQVRQNHHTRSLAAYAVATLADLDEVTAATSVIDDFNDNGVDAIYFDRPTARLILVQAKFKQNGAAPDLAETKKFCDGVRDLVAQRFDRFNDAFQAMLPEVDSALETTGLKILAVVVWTGDQIELHASRELDDLKRDLNEFHPDRCSIEKFTLIRAHTALANEHAQPAPDVRLTLENWYRVEVPIRAYYGQVSASTLAALFTTHGKALFEKNIRNYMGRSGVNDAISHTLREEPAHMFYLNNGITAICSGVSPLPTAVPASGQFQVTGFSVVNGAQTVGSISGAALAHPEQAAQARLFITLIEINGTTPEFGSRITRARNFQNQVRLIDFVALDPLQERLRRELAISGIAYHYKPSLEAQRRDNFNLTMEEAGIALACFSGRTDLAVIVKKEVGKLFDRNGPIYATLFAATTDAGRVWRYTQIFRFLDAIFSDREFGPERLFYRHMRHFVLHIWARRSRVLNSGGLMVTDDEKLILSREIDEIAAFIYNEILRFPTDKGMLAISRNLTDATQLAGQVMRALAARDNPITDSTNHDVASTGAAASSN